MYNNYSAFFSSKNIKPSSALQFSNVEKIPLSIKSLYRGDSKLSEMIFLLPTLLMGVFCKSFPEVVNMEQLRLHKLTNLSNDFHMVSMSEDPQIAIDWGNGSYITIDPTLFSDNIVNVHESFKKNQLNFPSRMEKEKEHIALAIPFTSIKKITIDNKEFSNPFYVNISPNDQEAITVFDALYSQLIALLRKKYTQEIEPMEEKEILNDYVTAYLEFYAKFSTYNPFQKSCLELFNLYPEFMDNFFRANHLASTNDVLQTILLNSSGGLFSDHPYTKSINASYISRIKESITCYEDDWAKPAYD